jgi:hypothetical protein
MDKPSRVVIIGLIGYVLAMFLLIVLVAAWYTLYAFGYLPEPKP